MLKIYKEMTVAVALLTLSLVLSGCSNSSKLQEDNPQNETPLVTSSIGIIEEQEEVLDTPKPEPTINLEQIKPNEVGKVMVVMFHNFQETFTPSKYDKGEYTTTFSEFEKLLPELYEKDYRLISLNDYLTNDINVPAGCIPIIFTFDDGTQGQFNLVEDNGNLISNNKSAVGIIEEFNKTHPDFGINGTFFVNLGNGTFQGAGTLEQRLKYLIDKGFEIGNHTFTHINLMETDDADKIQKEIGQNQKKIMELIPGYKMTAFSLPYGLPSKNLQQYVQKGVYEDIEYNNLAIMEVGWDPTFSPVSISFNPLSTHRVRASGIKPVEADLAWWIENMSRGEQYVSDGNPDVIAVPKIKEENVDGKKLGGKKLIVY